ncbi:hypothetical protein [Actomonas aquatica]|uniref:Uncharacterized protein n=1 Tax=Actomonas aquatica TaxID=2866162 RepID=A0ABZ1C6L5_9BACT|nr:hypothetical protein [Opitutus sp. WL0086]WRQ86169.1 hypothetical protein K1X11_015245 [Opitutus sp. WL0086]
MSQIYHLEYSAPFNGQDATFGKSTATLPLPEQGGITELVLCPTDGHLGPGQTLEMKVTAAETESAIVIITAGNWPRSCNSAVQLELGGGYNELRKEYGSNGYGVPERSEVTLTFDAEGLLQVAAAKLNFSIDVSSNNSATDRHEHRVIVVPKPNLDDSTRLSQITVELNGVATTLN